MKNRGFVIVAQNNSTTDYIKCAKVLAGSIKNFMPNEKVSLITDVEYTDSIFDSVIIFPHGDTCPNNEWKLANDWQVYDASPYELTIKLEADLYITRDISWWWDRLESRDLFVCTTIRNYLNEISDSMYYRQFIVKNNLPNTYNAITYFKKSDTAKTFFSLVREIFEKWDEYKKILKCDPKEYSTTDFVYAIAARILGEELCTDPALTDISMIHMKKFINDTITDDWTNELYYEISKDFTRINSSSQLYPLHYHIKSYADAIIKELHE